MSESFPCIICGKVLQRAFDQYEGQPDDGVMCSTEGNYGSTAFDPMDGTLLCFNICDSCLVLAGQQGRVMASRSVRPVLTDTRWDETRTIRSIVGWERVERPYIPWHENLAGDDDKIYYTKAEIRERLDRINMNIDVETLPDTEE